MPTGTHRFAIRGVATAEELERRVFLVGDPPQEEVRNSPRSNKTPFFPGCAKCHEMEKNGAGAPEVLPTQVAERWVHHGPFTHLPHSHMDCTDCYGAAKTSTLTSDILMPSQKLCAECHRSLDKDKLERAEDTLKLRAELKPGSRLLADQQRKTGGVKADCLSCNEFRAPPTATLLPSLLTGKTGERAGINSGQGEGAGGSRSRLSARPCRFTPRIAWRC